MVAEKTLEDIVSYICFSAVIIPATYYGVPLIYYTIKELAELYFKKEEKQKSYEKSSDNMKNKI